MLIKSARSENEFFLKLFYNKRMRHVLIILLSAVFISANAFAAPKAELWARWQKHDSKSAVTLSHKAWDDFLNANISPADGIHLLNYGGVSANDKKMLDDYLTMLSKTAVSSFNRDEQRAFWINLYNALTVQTVLNHYPVDSIRDIDISPGLFSDGPWGKKLFTVEGEELSLNDIEHQILRPIWRDARLHYAVNCASIGCPNLAAMAYTADNTEELLDAGSQAYINHPRGVQVKDGNLIVSSIYTWFIEDFGGDDAGVIAHLKKYATADLTASLDDISNIADDTYDWSLNKP